MDLHREPFTPNRLFSPGPTPTPAVVKEAYLQTDIYHRSKEFESLVKDCSAMLKPILGTSTQPVLLTASGTGAMEAAIVNLTAPDDQVIVLACGKFGERWQKIAQAHGCRVHTTTAANGQIPTLKDVDAAFKSHPAAKAVCFQAHETSTGVRLPVAELAAAIRQHSPSALIIVDAISSLGAHPMEMDAWGLDCVVSGSQKGFGVGPGLSFVALSERAWKTRSTRGRFYFDLEKERKGQETGRTAFTPAINLVLGLHAALTEIKKMGVPQFLAHHERLAKATRAAVTALGLEFFVQPSAMSNTLTSIKVPESLNGSDILNFAKVRYGAIISGGQDDLKGKIIRFSHLGFVSPFQLIEGLAAFEFALSDAGWKFNLGVGVSAAMTSLHEHGSHQP